MGDWAVGLEFNNVFMTSKRIQLETKVSQECRVTNCCPTLNGARTLFAVRSTSLLVPTLKIKVSSITYQKKNLGCIFMVFDASYIYKYI